jgi:phytoene dehydrogenase-like protein
VSTALVAAARQSGEVRFGSRVASVEVSSDGAPGRVEVNGVRLTNGEIVRAKKVLLNADAAAAEPLMLGKGAGGRDYKDKSLSSSVVAFHWALNKTFAQLAHHSLFLAVDDGGGGGWDVRAKKIKTSNQIEPNSEL